MKNNNNTKLMEIIEFAPCKTDNVLGYIKDLIGQRNAIMASENNNFKDFVIIGKVNGYAVFCTPKSTVKGTIDTYRQQFSYEKALNMFKFLQELTNEFYEEQKELPDDVIKNDLTVGTKVYLNKDMFHFEKNTEAIIVAREILFDDIVMYTISVDGTYMEVLGEALSLEREESLNSYIDHTNLSNTATHEDFETLCLDAHTHEFATVCVPPMYVSYCNKILSSLNSKTKVCTVVGFPMGYSTISVKASEATDAILNGAKEIDYVLCVNNIKDNNWFYIEQEMKRMTEICHQNDVLCKVIMETCLLTDDEIRKVCSIAKKIGIDFVKTSTGFSKSGATVEAVKLMAETLKGSKVKVKASGGIRTKEDALKMIEVGASRIGTSAGISIVE